MKPQKKKVKNDSRKTKEFSESNSAKKIDNYFPSAPKPFVEDNSNECRNPKAFYIKALKAKLQGFAVEAESDIEGGEADAVEGESGTEVGEAEQGEDGACGFVADNAKTFDKGRAANNSNGCMGCTEKDVESKMWELKYKELKKVYLKLTVHFSELDLKYNELLKTKTHTNQPEGIDTVALNGDVFSPNETKMLQTISLQKENDSSFILQSLRYAYKNDLTMLRGKTLMGKPEFMLISEDGEVDYHPEKEPLTPRKVNRIKELYVERISKCKIDSVSYTIRIKDSYVNKLFATGIKNIVKKLK